MDFFGIGSGELLLILIVALIIWGPGRLPEIARTLGKTVRTVRRATYELTNAVTREVENDHQPPKLRQSAAAKPEPQPSATKEPEKPEPPDITTQPPSAAAEPQAAIQPDIPEPKEGQQQ
ncbi:MAG: twin-arginine translocase TatA/TatE family subunit [Chloroflexota bacterium]